MRPGRFLIVGVPGPSLDPSTGRLLDRLRPGGVILFARNIESPGQLGELTGALRRRLPETILWLDAEGGPVDRLRPVAGAAPSAAWLASHPPALARRAGRWVGHALRHFGFDADFAPVVDLDRGNRGNALDDRTYGRAPRTVVARAQAWLSGLQGSGIGGCVKHFPGLGGATADTHLLEAPIDLGAEELERDLEPFAALARPAGAVMVGHALYRVWDPRGRPATLSPPVLEGLLRRRLGFAGVAVADDLEMRALAAWGTVPECAEACFAAGCDLLPICRHLELALKAAERLGAPALAVRRQQAAERLEAYRRHLVRLAEGAPRRFGLEAVRRGLAAVAAAG